MVVREATTAELPAVLNVLDGAALATEHATVQASIDRGETLVAMTAAGTGPIIGALVLDGDHICSVAVRRRRRSQGIGTALVEAAAARRDRLTAQFDPAVRPFYEQLGFEITAGEEDSRLRAILESA
jgi:GNAT superfamily N-acetyltransferase